MRPIDCNVLYANLINYNELYENLIIKNLQTDDKTNEEIIRIVINTIVLPIIASQPTIKPEPRWMPITNKPPEECKWYLVSVQKNGISNMNDVCMVRWDYDRRKGKSSWHWCTEKTIVAWMPLPEPWKGDTLE